MPLDDSPSTPRVRRLRVTIGSRCLDDTVAPADGQGPPEAGPSARWAKGIIWTWMRSGERPDLFLSGYARGPDRWGSLAAYHLRIPRLEFRLDGRRWTDGRPVRGPMARWAEKPAPASKAGHKAWKDWCFARDQAMGAAAQRAVQEGWEVELLAVIAPWSGTHGTEYSLEFFQHERIKIEAVVAPLSLRPASVAAAG